MFVQMYRSLPAVSSLQDMREVIEKNVVSLEKRGHVVHQAIVGTVKSDLPDANRRRFGLINFSIEPDQLTDELKELKQIYPIAMGEGKTRINELCVRGDLHEDEWVVYPVGLPVK